MSNTINTRLLEEAADYIDNASLSGTGLDKAMELDIEHNDLDSLWLHITQARNILQEESGFNNVF